MIESVDTDVLVIGGGAAGTNAALKAADKGARVAVVVKGLMGKSGCSIFASHLPYHDTSTEQKGHDRLRYSVRYYNHYLTDQDYCLRMGKYMRTEFFPDLEKLGVYWRRGEDGRLMATATRTPTIVSHKQGASGVIIMDKRRRAILGRGIPVHEECAATGLLQDGGQGGGRIVGATLLDLKSGRFFAVRAKAVVLATGHSDYLATRSTGTREQSADGIAMALRAGAETANLEIQWWHISDVLEPRSWMRYHLYPNPLLGTEETSRLYNQAGEMFYEQRTHSPASSAPYVEQIRRLAREVMAGKARWDGGYWSGYDHIPAETIMAYQHQAKIWGKLGLDVGKDRIECGITMHMRQGGIDVDTQRMTTSLPGLYLAGGIGSHYLGGVGPVSYDGKVAGEAAAEEALGRPDAPLPAGAVADEEKRVFGFLQAGPAGPDAVRPIAAKLRIREIMWELGYVKNEAKLNAALDGLLQVRAEMVPRFRLESASRAWNTGWQDALDVAAMLDACEATVRSGLLRKESRGPFFRDDYPFVDNETWLCKTLLRREGGEWRSRTAPIPTPHLKPEKLREPFFDADY
ncbi:MAG: FAD-binding protein [Alphaproteobacteria bacterium]|nr:FAD-binding protein [Alphaproteobacteria bacterium]